MSSERKAALHLWIIQSLSSIFHTHAGRTKDWFTDFTKTISLYVNRINSMDMYAGCVNLWLFQWVIWFESIRRLKTISIMLNFMRKLDSLLTVICLTFYASYRCFHFDLLPKILSVYVVTFEWSGSIGLSVLIRCHRSATLVIFLDCTWFSLSSGSIKM